MNKIAAISLCFLLCFICVAMLIYKFKQIIKVVKEQHNMNKDKRYYIVPLDEIWLLTPAKSTKKKENESNTTPAEQRRAGRIRS